MEITGKTAITFTLNVDATNIVLSALSAKPYEQVASIIADIQKQASAQLNPSETV